MALISLSSDKYWLQIRSVGLNMCESSFWSPAFCTVHVSWRSWSNTTKSNKQKHWIFMHCALSLWLLFHCAFLKQIIVVFIIFLHQLSLQVHGHILPSFSYSHSTNPPRTLRRGKTVVPDEGGSKKCTAWLTECLCVCMFEWKCLIIFAMTVSQL